MSRAFVSEAAEEASAVRLPERPVSSAPNLVTPDGLAEIEAVLARLQGSLAVMGADDPARAQTARDLRYWRARRLSAQVVAPAQEPSGQVAFGSLVTVRRAGAVSTFRIVGEDQADPGRGLLGWTSPLAEALMGARIGDEVEPGGGRAPARVLDIARG